MAIKKTTTKSETGAAHADHPGGSVTTTDHDQIRAWAEARGGKPASVQGTGGDGDVGLIRIEFPGATNANDSNLAEITWDEFFQKFDESGLALVYQEQTADGRQSDFNKLVKRDAAAAAPAGSSAKRPTAGKKATAKRPTAAKKSAAKKTAKKGTRSMAKATTTTAKKSTTAKKTAAAKKAPAAKKTTAKKSATAKKAPAAAKKTAAKKTTAKKSTAKKVPAARGYRGR